jgi:hypothetical protein
MKIAQKHQIPIRIPAKYFRDIVSQDDLVIVRTAWLYLKIKRAVLTIWLCRLFDFSIEHPPFIIKR